MKDFLRYYLDLILYGGIYGAPKAFVGWLLLAIVIGLVGFPWLGFFSGAVFAGVSAIYCIWKES